MSESDDIDILDQIESEYLARVREFSAMVGKKLPDAAKESPTVQRLIKDQVAHLSGHHYVRNGKTAKKHLEALAQQFVDEVGSHDLLQTEEARQHVRPRFGVFGGDRKEYKRLTQELEDKVIGVKSSLEKKASDYFLDASIVSLRKATRAPSESIDTSPEHIEEAADRGVEEVDKQTSGATEAAEKAKTFFRDGEKMRWGRVTGVGLGVAAAGIGLGYLLSGGKKEDPPQNWTSRVEPTPGNSAQRGV